MMAPLPFSRAIDVRFRHADSVGIMFFGNIYGLIHDVYEDFVRYLGFEWREWFENPDWAVPIRHSSCEHLRPMLASEVYKAAVLVERIGKSSFTLKYVVEKDGDVHCEVTLVHTFCRKNRENTKNSQSKSGKNRRAPISIPSLVHDRLQAYQSECLTAQEFTEV